MIVIDLGLLQTMYTGCLSSTMRYYTRCHDSLLHDRVSGHMLVYMATDAVGYYVLQMREWWTCEKLQDFFLHWGVIEAESHEDHQAKEGEHAAN